ncbi:MAG: TonB-dependent receptor [Bacteroidetes bacterium]|nr:TonB-dependent receptor [Bacteroidota bacterium]
MKSALGLCFLLMYVFANAQGIYLSGRVTDAATGEGIAFAHIVMVGASMATQTDEYGKFKLDLTQASSHKMSISSVGYKTDTVSLSDNQRTIHISLYALSAQLNEVVVSGTMRAMGKMESPIPVEVYTAALLKKNPTPSLFESMHMITGVQPQLNCNVCNTGDIHINGLEGPYTMILIDGMPIVSALSSVYGLHGIPSSMVKRIEVVKGPASTLYGSEAVAGLINVITRDAVSAPLFKIDFSATSVGEFNTDVTTKWKTKKATSLLGMNYFNYWIPMDANNDHFTDVTLQNRISVFNKWDFSRTSHKAASLAWRYVYENRWGGEMNWSPQWRGTDSIYGETITTHRVELFGTYELPVAKENLRLDYSYNFHWQDSYYGTTKYAANQHTAFAQFVYDKQFKRLNLLAGIPLRLIYYDDNTPATSTTDSVQVKNKPSYSFLPGVFVQADYTPIQSLTILAGLRYDYHTAHGSIVTPRVSFKYTPVKHHTLRLTGGSGYRIVNLFTEDHAALSGAREVVIVNQLKPEQSWNGNLNYNAYFNHKHGFIETDISGFYTYFTNQIVGDFLSDPTKIIYDNLSGHAVSRGISFNTSLSFTNGLSLTAGCTYMDVYRMVKDSTGTQRKTPQLHAPAFTANYTVSYHFRKIGFSIDWTGKINGPMYLPVVPNDFRPAQSPWYCIMNFQLTQQLPKNLELYAGVKNMLHFVPKHPILRPFDPFDKQVAIDNPNGYTFDPSYNYAAIQGIKGFIGLRYTLN